MSILYFLQLIALTTLKTSRLSLVSASHFALYYENKKLSHILVSIHRTSSSARVFLTLLLFPTASSCPLTNCDICIEWTVSLSLV